jgi:hypothetical protein
LFPKLNVLFVDRVFRKFEAFVDLVLKEPLYAEHRMIPISRQAVEGTPAKAQPFHSPAAFKATVICNLLKLTLGLRLIGAHIAKFSRALNKPALSPGALLAVDALIAEVFDSETCHFRGLALAPPGTQLSGVGKTASFREPTNRDLPRRTIALFAAPLIDPLQK